MNNGLHSGCVCDCCFTPTTTCESVCSSDEENPKMEKRREDKKGMRLLGRDTCYWKSVMERA